MGFKQLTFRIDEELAKQLKSLAFNKETTQTQLVVEFIEKGIAEYDNQSKLI